MIPDGWNTPFFYRGTITLVCWSIGTPPNCNLNLIHPLPLRSFQWLLHYLQPNLWTSQPLSPQPLLPHWKACQRDCGEVFLPMPGNVPTWGQQLPASTLNGVGGALLLPPEASDGLQEFLWGWPVVLTHSLPKLLPDLYFSSSPSCCWLGLPESISYHKKHPRQLCSIGFLKTLQPQPPNSCFNRSWSTRTECPQRHLGSGQSSPWGGSWRPFWQRVPPGIPNRPLQHVWLLPVFPAPATARGSSIWPGGVQLLSSAECPRHMAEGQMTRPQIWSLTSGLWSLWLAQRSSITTPFRFRSGRTFLPVTPLRVRLLLPRWRWLTAEAGRFFSCSKGTNWAFYSFLSLQPPLFLKRADVYKQDLSLTVTECNLWSWLFQHCECLVLFFISSQLPCRGSYLPTNRVSAWTTLALCLHSAEYFLHAKSALSI